MRKKIGRKIQPKQFHSVEISIEAEDEIEWSDMAERQKKLDQLTALAIEDYERTFKEVCEALQVQEKKAFVKHRVLSDSPTGTPDSASGNQVPTDSEMGLFDALGADQ